jgi:hypothetical protein
MRLAYVARKAAAILIFKISQFSAMKNPDFGAGDGSKSLNASRELLRTCGGKPGASRRRRQ